MSLKLGTVTLHYGNYHADMQLSFQENSLFSYKISTERVQSWKLIVIYIQKQKHMLGWVHCHGQVDPILTQIFMDISPLPYVLHVPPI
jgi:hypothetical protein